MTNSRSVLGLSRNFVIPAGSQVVLTVAKQVSQSASVRSGSVRSGSVKLAVSDVGQDAVVPAESSQAEAQAEAQAQTSSGAAKSANEVRRPVRKPGSVGVVVKCPPHNDLPYLIQFNDGTTAEASFHELALRRQEIESQLSGDDYDYLQHVIYRCQVGSKAFGLANDGSDDDLRGIFLPPADKHWSLFKIPEQIELLDGRDEVYWEIEKFVKLALKANPNILETLWTPMVLDCDPVATELRKIRSAFLSKHVYKTYSGYVLSQFRRMKNSFEKTGKYKTKHAMHLLRLIHSGIGALETGEIMIDVSTHRESLLAVKAGQYSLEEVRQQALELDKQFQVAFENTDLPEQPDFERVNDFLIGARRRSAGY